MYFYFCFRFTVVDVALVCWVDCSCVYGCRFFFLFISSSSSSSFSFNFNLLPIDIATQPRTTRYSAYLAIPPYDVNLFNLNNLFVTIAYFSIHFSGIRVYFCTTVAQQSQIAYFSLSPVRVYVCRGFSSIHLSTHSYQDCSWNALLFQWPEFFDFPLSKKYMHQNICKMVGSRSQFASLS